MPGLGLPLCPITDLPRVMCGCPQHADSFTMTEAEQRFMKGGGYEPRTPAPVRAPRTLDSYLTAGWAADNPDPVCDHAKPPGAWLCPACEYQLRHLLADVPGLITELEITLTRQDRFPDVTDELERDPEEGVLPWREGASKATRQLYRALGGRPVPTAYALLESWPDLRRDERVVGLLARLAPAARFARAVVDRRPSKVYYGKCPRCGADIRQDRIGPDDSDQMVRCSSCGYSARLQHHQMAQLDLGEARDLTEAELMRVLNDGGEPVARHELSNVLHRHDEGVIPRTKVNRPRWREGKLVRHEVWTWKLGQVRSALLAKRVRRNR